jgi:hypothetical protein
MTKGLIAAFLLAASIAAQAQTPVEINNTSKDVVGQRLVFQVKEGIRRSSALAIEFDQSKPRMQVNIVTMDQDARNPGYSTVYSIVVLFQNPAQPFPFYLTQYVGVCGSGRVRECGDGIVANISEQADDLLRAVSGARQ